MARVGFEPRDHVGHEHGALTTRPRCRQDSAIADMLLQDSTIF